MNDGKIGPGPYTVSAFEREWKDSNVKLQGYHVKDNEGVILAEIYPSNKAVRVNIESARLLASSWWLLQSVKELLGDSPFMCDDGTCECGEYEGGTGCCHTRAHQALALAVPPKP